MGAPAAYPLRRARTVQSTGDADVFCRGNFERQGPSAASLLGEGKLDCAGAPAHRQRGIGCAAGDLGHCADTRVIEPNAEPGTGSEVATRSLLLIVSIVACMPVTAFADDERALEAGCSQTIDP